MVAKRVAASVPEKQIKRPNAAWMARFRWGEKGTR